MRIIYVFRKTRSLGYSIEMVFNLIISEVSKCRDVKAINVPKTTNNLMNVFQNIFSLNIQENCIYHVTGDVHYMSLKIPKKKSVLTIHDIESVYSGKGFKKWVKKILWFTLPAKNVEFITVISKFSKKQLLEIINFPEHKIKVIHNPVSPEFKFRPKKNMNDTPTILQIGTKENKNLPRLFEAIKGIKCQLNIVGELNEQYKEMLIDNEIDYEIASNLSSEQILQCYVEADIVSFVSTYEGFGMPIIEAQAIGRPVITSNIEPLIEVAGDGACFADPYNVEGIRISINKIIEDENYRKLLIEKGSENVKRFDVKKISAQYLEIYKSILE